MNYKDELESLKNQLEMLNGKITEANDKHSHHMSELQNIKDNISLKMKLTEEKLKESWIINPNYLVTSVNGFCLEYPCEWKNHERNKWSVGYIVGSSCATKKLYKVRTSVKGDNYEWACIVRIDPEELRSFIRENTHRMLSEYNIDMEEYE